MASAKQKGTSSVIEGGHDAMKQIYDDLGIFRDIEWHKRQSENNVAHNWNRGDDMSTIFGKLLDGRNDPTIIDAIKSGEITQAKFDEVRDHYISQSPSGAANQSPISALHPPAPPKSSEELNREFGKKETFLQNYVPKTVDKEVVNTWGTVTETQYTKDISDQFTTELLGERGKKWGIDAEEAQAIETAFIDEVYGTDAADATTWEEGTRAWADPNSGYNSTWGLDLVRVYDKDLEAGTPAMTEHLTKGAIDYAHYLGDTEYKKAFARLGYNLEQEGLSDETKATMIREARQNIHQEKTAKEKEEAGKSKGWLSDLVDMHQNRKYKTDEKGNLLEPTEWEGMADKNKIYTVDGELYIDDIRQRGILELLNDDKGRYNPELDDDWQENKLQPDRYKQRDFEDLSTPEYRQTLNLPPRSQFGLSIKQPEGGPPVERPSNIPKSWGKV